MADKPPAYDLFLDESGQFVETSTDPAELAQAARQPRPFPSQLAGLLVSRDALSEGDARKLHKRALAGTSLTAWPHARDVSAGPAFDALLTATVQQLQKAGAQPVRLVNAERVRYGERAATYANLVAELVLRVCQQKLQEGQPRLSLRLFPARLVLREEANGTLVFLERDYYRKRVQEYLGFAAVRHGLARESAWWRLDDLHIRPGDDPRIHLCDLVSNASHDDFRKCGPDARAALAAALGACDFTLYFRELTERVRRSLAEGGLSHAIIALVERLIHEDAADDLRDEAHRLLREVLARLATLPASARDLHLAAIAGWVEQVVEVRRDLDLGLTLAGWLLARVEPDLRAALREADRPGLDWFAYALRTLALTTCNHSGDLAGARQQVQSMERILPNLAGQWEHAPVLMRGLIHQAVHLTDCFDHDGASARMKVVAGYYASLGELFNAALPTIFPQRVRSDLHGRALGTWMQSELYAGLVEPARLVEARRLNERAIDEFPAESDRERQYQYRCQLEAAAGNWEEARRYLARSLRLAAHDHAVLARAIAGLGEGLPPTVQGFALLHWLRLGTTACLAGAGEESAAFLGAVEKSGALSWPWCRGEAGTDYPAHGILRRVAALHALRGDATQGIASLERLGEVLAADRAGRLVLEAIRLAAVAEVAGLLWEGQPAQARRLLDSAKADRPGLLHLLDGLRKRTEGPFPTVWQTFAGWTESARQAVTAPGDPKPVRTTLLGLARVIGY